jgi:hypothetical protein
MGDSAMEDKATIKPLLFAASLILSSGIASTASANPPAGRMTGGGTFLCNSEAVTLGFQLHCGTDLSESNNLEINFTYNGEAAAFHLTELTTSICNNNNEIDPAPPAAPVDTLAGEGIGKLRLGTGPAESDATIAFKLWDAGEPGSKDAIVIYSIADAGGNEVLSCPFVLLQNGNFQTHRLTGNQSQ